MQFYSNDDISTLLLKYYVSVGLDPKQLRLNCRDITIGEQREQLNLDSVPQMAQRPFCHTKDTSIKKINGRWLALLQTLNWGSGASSYIQTLNFSWILGPFDRGPVAFITESHILCQQKHLHEHKKSPEHQLRVFTVKQATAFGPIIIIIYYRALHRTTFYHNGLCSVELVILFTGHRHTYIHMLILRWISCEA